MKKGRLLLRVIRAAQEPKLTQHVVARRAGLHLTRYWQIENGYGPEPSDAERDAVAAALGVRPTEVAWPVQPKVKAS